MSEVARTGHLAVVWLFAACCVIQTFLAGLAVFSDPARFATHRDFGYLFGWLVIVVLVLALVGRLGRRQVGLAVGLLALFALQSVFVALRASAPEIAALHPLNGFLILAVATVSGVEAWTAWRTKRRRSGSRAPASSDEPEPAGG